MTRLGDAPPKGALPEPGAVWSRTWHRPSLAEILPRSRGALLPSPRGIVDKVIHCDCGFDARAEHEGGLVAEVRRHAWEAHGMALSHDEALLLAFRAELDVPAPSPKPGSKAFPDPSDDVMSDPKEEEEE